MLLALRPYQREVEGDLPSIYEPQIEGSHRGGSSRPYYEYWFCCRKMSLYLLVSEEDWVTNEAMYQAMLKFPNTYAYTLHPQLLYTLYVSPSSNFYRDGFHLPPFEVAYPENWVEYYDAETNQIYFLPEGSDDRSQAVTLSFNIEKPDLLYGEFSDQELETWLDDMTSTFNLSPEARPVLREAIVNYGCGAYPLPTVALEQNGRIGYLISGGITLTTTQDSPITDTLLEAMAESWTEPPSGCG